MKNLCVTRYACLINLNSSITVLNFVLDSCHSWHQQQSNMSHRKPRSTKRSTISFIMGPGDEKFTISQPGTQQNSEKRNARIVLVTCVKKYFDATTLHGFKYLSEPNRPLYERIYWLIAILLVYSTVGFIIVDQVKLYLKSPVLITFDSKSRSVEEIPFPAVTICSDNQIHSSMINLTEAFADVHLLSSDMKKRFEYAVFLCDFHFVADQFETFDSQFVSEMLETVFGIDACTELITKMEWLSVTVNTPCRYFQPMVTIQGACLSFNMLPFTSIFRHPTTIFKNWAEQYWVGKMNVWSPDSGFVNGAGVYPGTQPWKTIGNNQLFFGLNINTEDYEELCSRGGRGFYVYVHNPAEMPSQSHALLYLEENRDTTILVSPKLYITDENLKKWPTKERGCYFQNERFLKFFHIYTQHNCELECKANVTLNICRCVPHHFPTNSGESTTCDCLPSCSELQYEVRVNKAPRNLSQNLTRQTNETFTLLKVMFQTNFFIGIKRTVMFGLSDFIANVGGLLGLFLGFSILSFVEIVYFILFRPCTNYARRNHKIKPFNFRYDKCQL